MSFALTTDQIKAHTKTVTRRMGWLHLKAGDLIRPVKKCMGLKKGEKIEPLGPILRIVRVRREPLSAMVKNPHYGHNECIYEGFGEHPEYKIPGRFVEWFAKSNNISIDELVTRIEFVYETPV